MSICRQTRAKSLPAVMPTRSVISGLTPKTTNPSTRWTEELHALLTGNAEDGDVRVMAFVEAAA